MGKLEDKLIRKSDIINYRLRYNSDKLDQIPSEQCLTYQDLRDCEVPITVPNGASLIKCPTFGDVINQKNLMFDILFQVGNNYGVFIWTEAMHTILNIKYICNYKSTPYTITICNKERNLKDEGYKQIGGKTYWYPFSNATWPAQADDPDDLRTRIDFNLFQALKQQISGFEDLSDEERNDILRTGRLSFDMYYGGSVFNDKFTCDIYNKKGESLYSIDNSKASNGINIYNYPGSDSIYDGLQNEIGRIVLLITD